MNYFVSNTCLVGRGALLHFRVLSPSWLTEVSLTNRTNIVPQLYLKQFHDLFLAKDRLFL